LSAAASSDGAPAKRVAIRPDIVVEGNPPLLVGSRDRITGQVFFPAEAMNPVAMTEGTLDRHTFEGSGRLVAWTVVARGLPGFDSPYALATVQLDAGPSLIAQLHAWQGKALRPGMRLALAVERIKSEKDGTEVIGPKFVPVED
jgi:uncharacterized OB-fold protein